ncbi:uncharacterized protein LOC125625158 isoform X1 [Caretta caretta]|uniref:uncharacterized protein LOC125625158 isoform X1 n=2 Tax=Caretta caretta TaxID=8467 RepID=UPI002095B13C|nr:uncharacterized protein LOC125625158 isoform X1 [Caretta caretta]XP_048682822.1 uncharacterized protein LOC125625158 isoform X1 [Caretta caretta]
MDGTQLACVKLLLIYHIVVKFSVQAADQPPPVNEDMQTEATSNESGNTTISRSIVMSTISDKEAVNTTTVQNINASWNTITVPAKITSSLALTTLSHFVRSTLHPPNTDNSSPSDIAIRFNTVVTSPTVSTFNQATDKDSNPRMSSVTLKPTAQSSTATQLHTSKALDSVPITQASGGIHLRNSEAILIIIFSSILTFAVLAIVICSLDKYRKRRAQYSHHPLYDTSSETADIYTTPDDTLMISGGLYDAPRIYNPNMTVLDDDELQAEYLPFGSRPGKFRLEILSGENEKGLSPTFDRFQPPPQHS